MYLYKYKELLEVINIIVIFSIPMISLIFYTISKDKSVLSEIIIYILEFCMYTFLVNNERVSNFILFGVIFSLKLLIIFKIKNNVSSFTHKFIIALSLSYILNIKLEYNFLINLVFNTLTLKYLIINPTKLYNEIVLYNKIDLNVKKTYIKNLETNIDFEKRNQKNYKDEILEISNKINKSIEASDIPIFILNINKDFIHSNESFKQLIREDKYNENDFDISKYLKFKFPEYDHIMNEIKNVTTGSNISINIKSYNKKVYRFESTTDIIDDNPVIICILKDITQTTLIQNKLNESEQMYKKLMDVLNEGVIIHDNKNIKYINDKGLDILELDFDENEISIDNMKNIISKKFRERFISNIESVLYNKEYKTTNKIELLNGKIVELITTNINLNNEDLLLSIVIDVTEFENTIMSIEQSEKTYKLLLQTLPEGIIIINPKNNKHIYRNKASMRLLKTIGLEKLNECIRSYLKNKEYSLFKRFTVDKINNIDISLAIVKREEEGTLVVVFRILDYEFKALKLEKELNNINAKNKFKTEFLHNIAYEIKKPIDLIFKANNSLIESKEKYKSDNINNHTRLVKQNCYRLIKLLNNVEAVSSIENNTCHINLKKCDIVKLVENIVEISKSYTSKKGLEIEFKSEINKKILTLDIDKVERIILNILSNAIKFTDIGGKITISIYMVNDQVCISIKDTGIGIPKDKTEVIFENFEQIDNTLSRGCEGTGMGLSVVKKLANLNNIKINVKSELNKGSEFEIILPNNILSKNIKMQDDFSQVEKVEIEYSDIYLNLTS